MVVTAQRDIDSAAAAAARVVDVHWRLVEFLKTGQTLAEIDRFVGETFRELDCKSAFFKYRIKGHPPYPSQACYGVNDCIVHGTHQMSKDPLQPGDVISIDIGVKHHKFIGDAAWTYAIKEVSDEGKRLMECGIESLRRGVAAMQPGRPLLDWARAVQECAEEEYGFHLVRGLGGHGYGKKLHGPPFVSNVMPTHRAEWPDGWIEMKPGMLLAVEPMIAVGTNEIRATTPRWPIFTADGSLSVHYEADVMIGEDGPINLTEGMFDLPMIVG